MTEMIEMKLGDLLKMVEEREAAMNQVLAQFNLQVGRIQGEISMINLLIEQAKDEALPSEDESPE